MRAANVGDDFAYRQLLERLAPALRSFVRRSLDRTIRSDADAEDIVQEVLLAIHLKRQTWIDSNALSPWVFTIAKHKTIDFLRRRGKRIEISIDFFTETLAAESDKRDLTGENLNRHLEILPLMQRKVILAVAVAGASITTTAKDLSMSCGAVRVALHRGLASLAARATMT